MALILIKWTNTAVLASPTATAQRASKRIKALGGSYDMLGFIPANDMAKSVSQATADIIPNRIYEFIVEAICGTGGPTPNNNGPVEGIVFQCIAPSFEVTHNHAAVILNLVNTDIHKMKVTLHKQSDDSVVGVLIANRIGDVVTANFAGLTPTTGYWVEIELYAIINGVEVISSATNYLNAICGTNAAPYQFTTDSVPVCAMPLDLEVNGSTSTGGSVDSLLTEDGDSLITEDGDFIILD